MNLNNPSSEGSPNPAVDQLLNAIEQQAEFNQQAFAALRQEVLTVAAGIQQVPTATPCPVAQVVGPALNDTAIDDDWSVTLLGPQLVGNPYIADELQALFGDLRAGSSAAMGLLGALLTFRSSEAEKMPRLLSQVGEAFYRWRPDRGSADDPLRTAFIEWIEGICEAHGVLNKVKLVQQGDRFDSTRHSTKDRGVEVAEVFGWLVLRDNGRVFSKANVALR